MVQQTLASGEEGQGVIPERWETMAPIYCLKRIPKQSTQCESISCSVVSDSLQPHGLKPARLLCPWAFCRQDYWSGLPCPTPGDLSNPGIETRFPALQANPLLSESPGKPKNTGMGSLSLLQGIFPTQRSNWGLLYCR